MSTPGVVDITEPALRIDLADSMSAVNEKDLALFVNDDAGRGVSRSVVFGGTEQGKSSDENMDLRFHSPLSSEADKHLSKSCKDSVISLRLV